MKKTVLFLACLLTMLTSLSANAAFRGALTELYTTDSEVNNVNGTTIKEVSNIYKVGVGLIEGYSPVNDEWAANLKSKFTLVSDKGIEYSPSQAVGAGMTATLTFDPAVAVPGQYVIKVAAEAVKSPLGNWNEALEVGTITIPGGTEPGPVDPPVEPEVVISWEFSSLHNAETNENTYSYEDLSDVNNVDNITLKLVRPEGMENAEWLGYVQNVAVNSDLVAQVKLSNGTDTFTPSLVKQLAGVSFDFNFATPVTALGSYSLSIPAGLVVLKDVPTAAAELQDMFSIKGGAEKPSFAIYNITPAAGEVTSLKEFRIDFLKALDLMSETQKIEEVGLLTAQNITLTCTSADAEGVEYKAQSVTAEDFSVYIDFGTEITALGTYELAVPAGFWRNSEFTDVENPGIIAKYTVAESQYDINAFTLDPASGSTVTSLGGIRITFTKAGTAMDGVKLLNDKMIDGDLSDITIIGNGKTYNCKSFNYPDADGNEDYRIVMLNFDDITENGEYTLTIPAGTFSLAVQGEPEIGNDEITATYTVDDKSALTGVDAQEDSFTVVDLAGRKVLEAAPKSALSSLDAGLYIVNGRKVMVK